jgi:hypothetical protein
MEPIHLVFEADVLNMEVPDYKEKTNIGFWIHPNHIFVELEAGIGFSIDKDMFKAIIEKIAGPEKTGEKLRTKKVK